MSTYPKADYNDEALYKRLRPGSRVYVVSYYDSVTSPRLTTFLVGSKHKAGLGSQKSYRLRSRKGVNHHITLQAFTSCFGYFTDKKKARAYMVVCRKRQLYRMHEHKRQLIADKAQTQTELDGVLAGIVSLGEVIKRGSL